VTCVTCGARSRILDSRDLEVYVKRRRQCVGCGERWSTVEVRVIKRAPVAHMERVSQCANQQKEDDRWN